MWFNNHSLAERLMQYVQIDTQADPSSETCPSSEKQKDLGRLLVEQLLALGIQDAEMDGFGYVYATIPSNVNHKVPTICFCAHVDTAPDCSGTHVKPILHKQWNGKAIELPDAPGKPLDPEKHPYLKQKIGEDIITASGNTLLGADDKAGVAIIMELAAQLMANPKLPHGPIRILFTVDEEIGRGVDKVDMKKLGADFGYTLDGGPRGSLEGENFCADAAELTFFGKAAHPGYAKGKMINAIKLAGEFLSLLPQDRLSPETTSKREGFIHPAGLEGRMEEATIRFILRDFEAHKLEEMAEIIRQTAEKVCQKHPESRYTYLQKEQYRNMRETLEKDPQIMQLARDAYRKAGLEPVEEPIRGGTDGSRLSFMGLPCPNIFTGEMAIHSIHEYCSVQDMEKALEVLGHLVGLASETAAKD